MKTTRHPADKDAAGTAANTSADTALASRRCFIRLVGGGAVLAATAPLAGCAASLPAEATEAWRAAPRETDPRRYMLAHALLAPNPHNRQPWIADLSVPDQIGLVCDGGKLLPETDPFGRQILIGCGAFIELAVIAASQQGLAVEVELFPAGVPTPQALPQGTRVATLKLGTPGSAQPDALHAQIARRHTNKSAYHADRSLPVALPAAWRQSAEARGHRAGLVNGDAAMQPLRRITREAYEIECTTPRTWLESAQLMRIGPTAIATHRDGISLIAAMPRLMHTLGMFDPMEVPQRGSSNHQRIMDRWAAFETGSGFLWLASRGNSRQSQIDAGRAYVRMHLQATAAGVDLHPLSQALQEFPEMQAPYQAVHRQLGLDPATETLQMLARTGYGIAAAEPSPRRGLQALIGV